MNYQERRRLQAQKTEEAILRSALTLMRQQGYDKVSVRDICNHAGITTGAFYHHFPSKEALLVSGVGALDYYVQQALADHEDEPPIDRLRFILTAYADFMERESGELTGQYYLIRLSNVSDPKRSFRLDPDRYIERVMVTCFDEAKARGEYKSRRSSQWAAAFCYRHFRGLVLDWILSGYSYSLRERMLDDFDALQEFVYDQSHPCDSGPA